MNTEQITEITDRLSNLEEVIRQLVKHLAGSPKPESPPLAVQPIQEQYGLKTSPAIRAAVQRAERLTGMPYAEWFLPDLDWSLDEGGHYSSVIEANIHPDRDEFKDTDPESLNFRRAVYWHIMKGTAIAWAYLGDRVKSPHAVWKIRLLEHDERTVRRHRYGYVDLTSAESGGDPLRSLPESVFIPGVRTEEEYIAWVGSAVDAALKDAKMRRELENR